MKAKPHHAAPLLLSPLLVLLAFLPTLAEPIAPIESDNFAGTTIDAAKWQFFSYGNGTFTQNNGLFYHNNGNGTDDDGAYMWSNGSAPVDSDWSVWFDARVPDLASIAAPGQDVDLDLDIWNTSNPENHVTIEFGVGVHSAPYGRLRYISYDFYDEDGSYLANSGVFFNPASQPEISFGVSWQASAMTLSVWYAPYGGATDWVRLASWNLGPGSPFEWDFGPGGGFALHIGGSSDNLDLQVADEVRISNFVASDSLISGRIPPTITTGAELPSWDFQALPSAGIGIPYGTTVEATGGALPHTWSLILGSLPAGLELNPATGTIHGTPTAAEFSKFRLRVTGADGAYSEANYRITVMPEPGDDDFVGTYWPILESHDNIRNFTGTLDPEDEFTFTVSTTDDTYYTLSLSDPVGNSFIIPDLLRTGNRLQNEVRPVVFPDLNLLDCLMLSDGVNRAFVIVNQEKYDPDDISVGITSWSTHIGPVTAADFVGFWDIEDYDDTDLLDAAEGFIYGTGTIEIRQLDDEHVQIIDPDGTPYMPLRVSGNQAFMKRQPEIADSTRFHTLRMHTDGERMSFHAVGSALYDHTDVAVTIGLGVKVAPTSGPPVGATGTATDLTSTTATLHGTVNPMGIATTAWFEYGPTTDYGSTAAVTLSPNDGTSTQDVSAVIEGLMPGQSYHYRLVAGNSAGTTTGADGSFATQPPPPVAPAELVAPKIEIVGGNVELTIKQSVAGRRYQLQQSETMEPGTWADVETEWLGDGGPLVIAIPRAPEVPRRFYRLALDPVAVPDGFALIPAGWFTMGRTSGDTDSNAPPVNVYVSEFYMATHEVTRELWNDVRNWAVNHGYTDIAMGGGKGATHPVHSVNWWDVVKWCNARSEYENATTGANLTPVYWVSGSIMRSGKDVPTPNWNASGYRLPTEAEWEKAARGGVSGQRFPWGDEINHDHANYVANGSAYNYDTSPFTTWTCHPAYNDGTWPYSSPVGSFAPNGYGLYDMAGNMGEWNWDWYSVSTYTEGASDPRGAAAGSIRVIRGGDWFLEAYGCRTAFRYYLDPPGSFYFLGFRLARSSEP